jgi:hypothetical protein
MCHTSCRRVSFFDSVSKAEALLQEQPSWPKVTSLQSFSLPLQRYTIHWKISKKWFPRFFVLANGCLYYSDGSSGHPDSKEGTLSFVRSNPAPDIRYCVEIRGGCAFELYTVVRRHWFTILQAALLPRAARQWMDRSSRLRSSSLQAARCVPAHKHAISLLDQSHRTLSGRKGRGARCYG